MSTYTKAEYLVFKWGNIIWIMVVVSAALHIHSSRMPTNNWYTPPGVYIQATPKNTQILALGSSLVLWLSLLHSLSPVSICL